MSSVLVELNPLNSDSGYEQVDECLFLLYSTDPMAKTRRKYLNGCAVAVVIFAVAHIR